MRAIMKRQLLHTPEGVRDIYNDECEKKMLLQDQLYHILRLHGYHPIQTPTFEFFDIFGREIGTTPSKDLYKFFDREGNTLVLRYHAVDCTLCRKVFWRGRTSDPAVLHGEYFHQ